MHIITSESPPFAGIAASACVIPSLVPMCESPHFIWQTAMIIHDSFEDGGACSVFCMSIMAMKKSDTLRKRIVEPERVVIKCCGVSPIIRLQSEGASCHVARAGI